MRKSSFKICAIRHNCTRKIRIGRQNPQYYEVLEGLEKGERVIVSGYESYKDNEVLVHIVCIPITGTSVNPARSIGPALFQGGEALSQLWLFIVAPFVGAAVSALVWNYFGDKNEKK